MLSPAKFPTSNFTNYRRIALNQQKQQQEYNPVSYYLLKSPKRQISQQQKSPKAQNTYIRQLINSPDSDKNTKVNKNIYKKIQKKLGQNEPPKTEVSQKQYSLKNIFRIKKIDYSQQKQQEQQQKQQQQKFEPYKTGIQYQIKISDEKGTEKNFSNYQNFVRQAQTPKPTPRQDTFLDIPMYSSRQFIPSQEEEDNYQMKSVLLKKKQSNQYTSNSPKLSLNNQQKFKFKLDLTDIKRKVRDQKRKDLVLNTVNTFQRYQQACH